MFDIITITINNTTRSIEGMYYLYVKTHNKTGFKYLGKTKRDPFKYLGSGTRWLNHVNYHGHDITTEIIKECATTEELKFWGVYYSQLWDIVNSLDENGNKIWANLRPEQGDGGDTSMFIDYSSRDQSSHKTPAHREKQSISAKKRWTEKFNDPEFNEYEFKKMCSLRTENMWKNRGISEEDRHKRSVTAKNNFIKDPTLQERTSEAARIAWDSKPIYYEITHPGGKVETVMFLRRWCKDNKVSYSKLYGSIRRNKPTKDGWIVRRLPDV